MSPSRFLHTARALAALLLASVLAAPALAAPDFVVSGRAPELEKTTLATLPGGPVSALDLLLYDQMDQQQLWSVPLEALLEPKSLAAERYRALIEAVLERYGADEALAGRAGGWLPPEDEVRVLSYPAAEAAWIDQNVVPEIQVEDADIHRYYIEHANDYLRRRQVQVRYIFKRVDLNDEEAVSRLRTQLEAVAYQVRQGTRAFADAARELSDARSAAQGGLLPEFFDNTYFPAFEESAFNMDQPGQLSQVFPGPGGLYLEQLVKSYPTRNITIGEVTDAIRQTLRHEDVEHYYQYLLDKLEEKTYSQNFAPQWTYQNLAAPIAIVGSTRLARQDFIRFFGNPTSPDYTVRWDVIANGSAAWVEGETVLQDLEQHGGAQHRWILRARQLAAMRLRARRTLAAEVPEASYATPRSTVDALTGNDALGRYFRAYHLVQFTIVPSQDPTLLPADQRQALRLAAYLEDQLRRGQLETEPAPTDLTDWRRTALSGSSGTLSSAVRQLDEKMGQTKWPNVKVTIRDLGWVTPMPDSPTARLLSGVAPGEFGRTQVLGGSRSLSLVMEAEPAKIEPLLSQPVALRELAFAAEAETLRDAEVARLKQNNQIQTPF